jgi:hypothetical protein
MANSIIPLGTEHSVALHTLVRRRAQLDGDLERQQEKLRELHQAIKHLDAVLVLLKPDIDLGKIAPKRARPPHVAAPGEMPTDRSRRGHWHRRSLRGETSTPKT